MINEHYNLSVILVAVKQLPIKKYTHILKKCSDNLNLKVIPPFLKCFSMSFLQANVSLNMEHLGSPSKDSTAGVLSPFIQSTYVSFCPLD